MKEKITCFEDLIIWQKAQLIAVKIYRLLEEHPLIKKDFGLADQLKRAAVSISDNIAEGFEYSNNPDFYRFLRISKGSCGEVRNKIHFASKLMVLPEAVSKPLLEELTLLGRQIGELVKRVKLEIDKSRKHRKPLTRNS